MIAVSALNTISGLISKALSDDSVSDEEYSLILLEFETFTRKKEKLREKSKMSFEQTGYIETEACFVEIRLVFRLEFMFKIVSKTMFKTMFKTVFKTMFKTMLKTVFKTVFKTMFKTMFKTVLEKI